MTDRTDAFTRANDAASIGTPTDAGSAWVTPSGGWGIISNTGYASSGGSQQTIGLESSIADADVQVTISTLSGTAGQECGLCGRRTDDSNYIMFFCVVGTGWKMYKKVAGSYTQLSTTATGTPLSGDVLKLRMNGSSLTGYVNGVSTITATDSAGSTVTLHGLRAHNDLNSRFDNFSITALAAATVVPIFAAHRRHD